MSLAMKLLKGQERGTHRSRLRESAKLQQPMLANVFKETKDEQYPLSHGARAGRRDLGYPLHRDCAGGANHTSNRQRIHINRPAHQAFEFCLLPRFKQHRLPGRQKLLQRLA